MSELAWDELSFAFALPLLLAFAWWLARRRQRRTDELNTWLAGRDAARWTGERPGVRKAQRSARALAWLALVIALMGPRFGAAEADEDAALDLIVALDVSRSMGARDLRPDRLRAARKTVRSLLEAGRGRRVGLVAFAGDAKLIVPLTSDLDSLIWMLEGTDELAVERGGTDFAAALQVAAAALESSPALGRAVLLVTDGEDHAGQGRAASTRLLEDGIATHALGVGTRFGAPIPVAREPDAPLLKDEAGIEVRATLDVEGLAALATAGNGLAWTLESAFDAEAAWVQMVRRARQIALDRDAIAGQGKRARFAWPLALALVLFAFDFSRLGARRK